MLLFQWGTYDWGEGEQFEIDIDNGYQTIPIVLRKIDGHWHLVEP